MLQDIYLDFFTKEKKKKKAGRETGIWSAKSASPWLRTPKSIAYSSVFAMFKEVKEVMFLRIDVFRTVEIAIRN